jgi:hypothetical protein
MKFLPDTGANITALDITHATDILEDTTVMLKVANGTHLKTLGTAEANFTMNGTTAPELIYVVEGLSEPLLSRRMLKALGLLPQTWPTIKIQEAVTNSVAKQANTDEHRRPLKNSYIAPLIVKPANTWKYSASPISDLVTTGLKPQSGQHRKIQPALEDLAILPKHKARWDTDSRWIPPSRTATTTTPTPSAPRTPRSKTRCINNYNEN